MRPTTSHRSRLLLGWAIWVVSVPAIAVTYRVTDTGVLANDRYGMASGINDAGMMTGISLSAAFDQRATLWSRRDGLIDLGIAPGYAHSQGVAVNNAMQVVVRDVAVEGYARDGAHLWSPSVPVTRLSPLPGDTGIVAHDINNAGMVAGTSYHVDDNASTVQQAVVWDLAGTATRIGSGEARAINDLGEVAGVTIEPGRPTAFIWSPAQGLTTFGAEHDDANVLGMNNRGQVVGYTEGPSFEAFVWSAAAGMRTIGSNFLPRSINDLGTVVGASFFVDGDERAFIWTPDGGMQDLNGLLDPQAPPGTWLAEAVGINNSGEIAALASIDGLQRAVLLTPVPEPGSMALVTLGVFALRTIRRYAKCRTSMV